MARAFTTEQADALAAKLDVDLDCGVCHACLSFVSLALDEGDLRDAEREIARMTPVLWEDGLAAPALAAVARARDLGFSGAAEALVDLERKGGKGRIARSIVRRLARDLCSQMRREVAIRAN
jgi:hypothetical protein